MLRPGQTGQPGQGSQGGPEPELSGRPGSQQQPDRKGEQEVGSLIARNRRQHSQPERESHGGAGCPSGQAPSEAASQGGGDDGQGPDLETQERLQRKPTGCLSGEGQQEAKQPGGQGGMEG